MTLKYIFINVYSTRVKNIIFTKGNFYLQWRQIVCICKTSLIKITYGWRENIEPGDLFSIYLSTRHYGSPSAGGGWHSLYNLIRETHMQRDIYLYLTGSSFRQYAETYSNRRRTGSWPEKLQAFSNSHHLLASFWVSTNGINQPVRLKTSDSGNPFMRFAATSKVSRDFYFPNTSEH